MTYVGNLSLVAFRGIERECEGNIKLIGSVVDYTALLFLTVFLTFRLLLEQEDEENKKKLSSQKTLAVEPQLKVDSKQHNQQPSVKWASNQAIDKFLSQSLSDAKALKLIKTLLAQQKSSSNLKKQHSRQPLSITEGILRNQYR